MISMSSYIFWELEGGGGWPIARAGTSKTRAAVHHHFEVGGWPETTVIVRFWIFAGVCVALGLGIFYADFINIPGVLD